MVHVWNAAERRHARHGANLHALAKLTSMEVNPAASIFSPIPSRCHLRRKDMQCYALERKKKRSSMLYDGLQVF